MLGAVTIAIFCCHLVANAAGADLSQAGTCQCNSCFGIITDITLQKLVDAGEYRIAMMPNDVAQTVASGILQDFGDANSGYTMKLTQRLKTGIDTDFDVVLQQEKDGTILEYDTSGNLLYRIKIFAKIQNGDCFAANVCSDNSNSQVPTSYVYCPSNVEFTSDGVEEARNKFKDCGFDGDCLTLIG